MTARDTAAATIRRALRFAYAADGREEALAALASLLSELDAAERALTEAKWGDRYALDEANKRVEALEAASAAVEEKLRAATNMLAEAERIVPGVITTSGRFALFGQSDRERLEAAEAALAEATQALREIAAIKPDLNVGDLIAANYARLTKAVAIARAFLASHGSPDKEEET